MNSVFLVKEGYPDFDVRGVSSNLETATALAKLMRSSYITLIYIIEEWAVDGEMPPQNIWQLEGENLRQVLKDGQFIYKTE